MKYQIKRWNCHFRRETILSHIDFEIQGNQKIAVVGRNGAGARHAFAADGGVN